MKKYLIIALTLLMLIPEGCTKYEDVPRITFRGAYKRISGIWQINTFEVDGIDSLALYNQVSNNSTIEIMVHNSSPEISEFYMLDAKKRTFHHGVIHFADFDNPKSDTLYIRFFKEDSLQINQSIGPFKEEQNSHWKIHRLSIKDLWISTSFNNKKYYLKCYKIQKNKYS